MKFGKRRWEAKLEAQAEGSEATPAPAPVPESWTVAPQPEREDASTPFSSPSEEPATIVDGEAVELPMTEVAADEPELADEVPPVAEPVAVEAAPEFVEPQPVAVEPEPEPDPPEGVPEPEPDPEPPTPPRPSPPSCCWSSESGRALAGAVTVCFWPTLAKSIWKLSVPPEAPRNCARWSDGISKSIFTESRRIRLSPLPT